MPSSEGVRIDLQKGVCQRRIVRVDASTRFRSECRFRGTAVFAVTGTNTVRMLILGVDPGSTVTGYGIIKKDGSRSAHVASGVIRLSGSEGHPKRLGKIFRGLEGVVKEHVPTVMVVESLFLGENSQSLMKLSQVRGVVLLLGGTLRHGHLRVRAHGDQERSDRLR